MRFRRTEEFPHYVHRSFENVVNRDVERCTLRDELAAELRIDECEKNQARIGANMFDRALQLPLATHKCVGVFMNDDAFELRQGRLGNRVQCFTGRIGHEMYMKSIHLSALKSPTQDTSLRTSHAAINSQ